MGDAARRERLAAALRANLRRRKQGATDAAERTPAELPPTEPPPVDQPE